jgi:hypothetical protein
MKSHSINILDNFICGWYIDTDLCDKIIDFFNSINCEKQEGSRYNRDIGYQVDKKFKNSIEAALDQNKDLCNSYYQELQKCNQQYIDKYPYCNFYAPWTVLDVTKIQYYPPGGGFYCWHTERMSRLPEFSKRHLVYMTYLNEVKNGGETEFFHQNLKIKPEKGLTIIWPADWTFTHRGISTDEEKYIVTGWFSFND